MKQPAGSVEVIGLDRERGWCVLRLPDGAVQLDFGPTGVVFAPAEFHSLAGMLERAQAAAPDVEILATGGPRQRILRCAAHGVIMIVFGRALVRLLPADFAAFVRLCNCARTVLGPLPYDSLHLHHTPAPQTLN